jgi:hypothetical protein
VALFTRSDPRPDFIWRHDETHRRFGADPSDNDPPIAHQLLGVADVVARRKCFDLNCHFVACVLVVNEQIDAARIARCGHHIPALSGIADTPQNTFRRSPLSLWCFGSAHPYKRAAFAQQLRQLSDIRRNPPPRLRAVLAWSRLSARIATTSWVFELGLGEVALPSV